MTGIKYISFLFALLANVSISVGQNQDPIADAGADTVVLSEALPVSVRLSADNSSDDDGSIIQYYWKLNGDTIGTESNLDYTFSELETTIELLVVDDSSATDTDVVKVFVGSPSNNGLNRIPLRNGQLDLFSSGMNIAWHRYASDLENYDDDAMLYFTAVMDSISGNHGNSLRWWLHTNGANTPIVNNDGYVEGIDFESIQNMKHVMDLAFDKNISLSMCLWSFDMLQANQGQDPAVMKKLLEDSANVQSYVDNALIPILELLGDHPAVLTWEIFNEPEGMTNQFGWTSGGKVSMFEVQRFVNMCAGAIHRNVPDALVSNGSWSFKALTDKNGNKNYYSDAELIEAGGDPDGTLDFYQVHYYPEHFGNDLSPFHRPAEYWELDKPILIGEFPADTIGHQANPGYSIEDAYEIAVEYGYAGIMSWSWSSTGSFNRDFTGTTAQGLLKINELIPDALDLHYDTLDIDRIPYVVANIPPYRTLVENVVDVTDHIDLTAVIQDEEDGGNLNFSITNNSNSELVSPVISASDQLGYSFSGSNTGTSEVVIKGEDSSGWFASTTGLVMVGSNVGHENNLAFYKNVTASNELNDLFAVYANDGNGSTYWQSRLINDQWLIFDLGESMDFNYLSLDWGSEYASHFLIETSSDLTNWTAVIEENDYSDFASAYGMESPENARYIRLNMLQSGTNNGLKLNEFEVENIMDNQPPRVKFFTEDHIVGLSQVRNLNNYIKFNEVFDDEHLQFLQYELSSDDNDFVDVDFSNGDVGVSLVFNEGSIGETTVSITAIDPFGLETTTTFKVEVYDDILGVPTVNDKLQISPNPSRSHINISTRRHSYVHNVTIYNMEGKVVLKEDFNAYENSIVIDELNAGVYIVEVQTEFETLKSRLIKE
ncbi:MAG: discoidin domain-containing protein [bacterium]|nr:discoidin domain-containing protein [bacterium]